MGMNGAAAGEIAEETKARLLEMSRAYFGQCVARHCAQQLRKIGACTEECGHAAHGNAHEHKPNRKEYWVIFGVLFALTVLEVVVAQVPGIAKTSLVLALVMLALVKAVCVALFYMHLKHETRFLKITVAIPLAMPALYAVVLIAEAMWRML